MSYGIGMAVAGANQGLIQGREEQRRVEQHRQGQERHDLSMEAGRSNLDWAGESRGRQRQEWEYADEDRSAEQQRREIANEIHQAAARMDVQGDPSAIEAVASKIFGEEVTMRPAPGGGWVAHTEHGGDMEFQNTQEVIAYAHTFATDDDAWGRLQQGIAEQQEKRRAETEKRQHELTRDHVRGGYGVQRSMIGRMAPGSVGMGEEGQFRFQEPPGGPGGAGLTAEQRNVAAMAEDMGISRAEAWELVQFSKGKRPGEAIQDIASTLMRGNWQYQNDPDAAFAKASELHQTYVAPDTTHGYGVQGQGGSPEQQADPQRAERLQRALENARQAGDQEAVKAFEAELRNLQNAGR